MGIIQPSPKGEEYTYCVPCCKSITVAVLGVYDLKSHLQTAGHKACLEKTKTFRPIDCHFKTHKQQSSTLESEVLFCQFVAEHNLPAAIADHFTYLVHRMFPDSEAAASFTFKHAKTSQVIKGSLAPAFTKPVIERCKTGPFSLMIDESNDKNEAKRLAILVRVFEEGNSAKTRILDMPAVPGGRAQQIFDAVESVLRYADFLFFIFSHFVFIMSTDLSW